MNETILNGLLNLFAIFASLAKIESDQARQAVNSYLTSHFGIRSHKEYMELFDEIQSVYDDPDFDIDRESVIINVCNQLKPKLIAEDQLLLLLRFMEFAHGNNEGLNENLAIFHKIATIFNIDTDTFDNLYAFVVGKNPPPYLRSTLMIAIKTSTISTEGVGGRDTGVKTDPVRPNGLYLPRLRTGIHERYPAYFRYLLWLATQRRNQKPAILAGLL